MMADKARIALGVVAATSVVVVSYLLVKIYGSKKKDDTFPEESSGERPSSKKAETQSYDTDPPTKKVESPVKQRNISAETETNGNNISKQSPRPTEPITQESPVKPVTISLNESEPDLLSALKKQEAETNKVLLDDMKQDKPIESEDVSKDEDTLKPVSSEKKEDQLNDDDTYNDQNDTSMVVVDDISVLEKSSSSVYTSANDESRLNESVDVIDVESSAEVGSEENGDESVVFVAMEKAPGKQEPDEKEILNISDEVIEENLPGENTGKEGKASQDGKLSEGSSDEGNGEKGMSASMSSWLDVGEARDQPEDLDAQTAESHDQPEDNSGHQDKTITSEAPPAPLTSAILEMNISSTLPVPSQEDQTAALARCQETPSDATHRDLEVIVAMLSQPGQSLMSTVLDSLVRVSAFTQHNVNLRDSGCPQAVTALTVQCCQDMVQGQKVEESLAALCQVVTNFSMDPKTQVLMETCLPALVQVFSLPAVSETLQQALLRPLTNFSTTDSYHPHYSPLVSPLMSLLDSSSLPVPLRVQALKVLVNLSLDADMLPHLLATQAPSSLQEMLELPTPSDLILRIVTFLANVEQGLQDAPRAPLAVPVEGQAESPLTLHIALRGVDAVPQLRNKVFRLTRHEEEDIVFQASRLYKLITATTK